MGSSNIKLVGRKNHGDMRGGAVLADFFVTPASARRRLTVRSLY